MKAILWLWLTLGLTALGANWPGFRGPTRQGFTDEKNLPLNWSSSSNVAWRTEIPELGWSSPIVWGDRIFLTTATESGQSARVLSIDKKSGKILWNTEVFRQVPSKKEGKNSYATPTPVTDGKLVYSIFADGSFAALDFSGKKVWENRDFKFYSQHGLGASPILHENLLIMPFDGSSQGEDKRIGWQKPWDQSFVVALDKSTGKVKWKTMRGASRIAHVTPNIWKGPNGKAEIISPAGDAIQGFNPVDGKLLWTIYSQGEGVVPSVVIGTDLIYTASGFEKSTIRAVKPGGRGEVTGTHIAWEQTRGVPQMSSFIYAKPHLYSVNAGLVSCYDEKSGEVIYQERIGGNYSASPVATSDRIYFLSEEGDGTVIKTGSTFEILAKNSLGERCQASYAVSAGHLYIRTEKALYAIGPK